MTDRTMTPTITDANRAALDRLMPYIRAAIAEGRTIEEAFVEAHEHLQSVCREILAGRTERARRTRDLMADIAWNKANAGAS